MPKGKDAAAFKPGPYAVTNEGARTRVRAGTRLPGTATNEGKPTTTEVDVRTPRQYLQLKASRQLTVKAGKARPQAEGG